MKISIIGTRGVPAHYGGFETCADEISVGLVSRGHQVSVYCRYGNVPSNPKEYRGVRLIYVPCFKTKVLGTLSHAFFSFLHVLSCRYDILMVFNAAVSPFCIVPKIFFRKIVLNVDGLEWRRRKWGPVGKSYYRLAEFISTLIVNRIVSDSKAIQKYYENKFHTPSTFIAYGAHIEGSSQPEILDHYGIKKGEYFFVASRLEPENNTDITAKAFEKVKTDKKLLIAGGANYKSKFIQELMKTKDRRIKFLGSIYTPGHIKELHLGAYAYVHGNEVGGTNPALLKALGYGNCVLALNVPFNAEVVGPSAILYERSVEDLRRKMQYIVDHPEEAEKYRRKAVERIKECYTWDRIIDGYERLFKNVLKGCYRIQKQSD
ncbi:hypothetical protein ES702_03226 [subsurface metagenome]